MERLWGVLWLLFLLVGMFYWSGVPGGGKCPEEEHTTCSGGPTNYNLSQARFMGRGIILFYKIRFYKIKCKI
jgi:hypothetical protein